MKDIKKLMITLVALLAVTTGAWAQGPVDGTIVWSVGNEGSATVSASIKDAISSTGVTTGSGLTIGSGTYFNTDMVKYTPTTANAGNVEGVMIEYTIKAVDGYKFKPTGVDYAAVQVGTDNASYSWSYTIEGVESAITDVSNTSVLRNTGSNSGTAQLMHSESITADGCSVFTLRFYISKCGNTKNICIGNITISGSVSAAPAASAVTVAWNKTTKTGTFSMPGGNVELEPEYYPQAALTAAPTAINDVPATTDGAILKAGTVATIGSTEQAQGTVMYYVSPTALDDAALLALAADQWTADVPTAAHLAQGQAYVYYYVRGNDSDTDDETFSDGDILAANALTVTIAAAPTYAVTFAEGTDANEWTASPATDVTKGQTVTVTYTGSKKVLGVKAEKKAKPAGPVTYTELKGGEVLHVGDIINPTEEVKLNDGIYINPSLSPYTVLRANITEEDPGDPTVTPADDGAYYVIQDKNGNYYFGYGLPVTATSDGILVTYKGISFGYKQYTFTVHEP